MRDSGDEILWGRVEKIGKGTRANYDSGNKTLTFCFTRDLQTSSEQLKRLRESLVSELEKLGYKSRIKYNGEVVVDNVEKEDATIVKKNHKLIIHLNKRQSPDQQNVASGKGL
jgi:hypothetical protein